MKAARVSSASPTIHGRGRARCRQVLQRGSGVGSEETSALGALERALPRGAFGSSARDQHPSGRDGCARGRRPTRSTRRWGLPVHVPTRSFLHLRLGGAGAATGAGEGTGSDAATGAGAAGGAMTYSPSETELSGASAAVTTARTVVVFSTRIGLSRPARRRSASSRPSCSGWSRPASATRASQTARPCSRPGSD